jgi:hypothetical protein
VMEVKRGTLDLPERELRHKPLMISESIV